MIISHNIPDGVFTGPASDQARAEGISEAEVRLFNCEFGVVEAPWSMGMVKARASPAGSAVIQAAAV
ncbi:MAG: hypothetical protein HQK55_10225 [Deltaproteobacteria bacterium]|nr:hypothetical protein [Deltaproteobacteria bacterium]